MPVAASREAGVYGDRVSPQRVIRPAARRTPAGAKPLLWTAAAAALPVIVTVLVLLAITLGLLVFSARGFDSLFAVVAVEWLVVNRVPLTVGDLALGFLPLLPPLLYVGVLARQTRLVLADIEEPGPREAGAAIGGVALAGALLTVLATLLVGSADSDFAVRQENLPVALAWTLAVSVFGSGLGVWLYFRHQLRESLPLWVRGGVHLGAAFLAALWAIATALVLIGLLGAWGPVSELLGIGKGFVGTVALAGISMAYLPNVVAAAATIVVGGEAHLGEASFSVFAVSRGPMPEVPLAGILPTTNPPWAVQGLLLVAVLVAAVLSRSVAHWFRTTADAVKATALGAVVVAVVIVLTPVIAGGQLAALGMVGTGSLIAGGTALLIFGVIGSATIALSLAGLTRRRERAESELARRRQRAGTAVGAASARKRDSADAVAEDHETGDNGDNKNDNDDNNDNNDDDEVSSLRTRSSGGASVSSMRPGNTEAEAGAEAGSEAEAETGAVAGSEAEEEAEAETETETEAEAEADAAAGTGTDTDTAAESDQADDADPLSASDPDADADADHDFDAGLLSDAESAPAPDSAQDSDSHSDLASDAEDGPRDVGPGDRVERPGVDD